MKTFILLSTMLLPVSCSLAGENIPLDKEYSFRLGGTTPEAPAAAPALTNDALPERVHPAPLRTPEGQTLPPGTRTYQFNGQPYYFVPLGA